MLRILARFIAVVCAIAFVVCTAAIIFLHAAGTRLTHPQVYKDALLNERLYERLPTLVADTFAHAVDAGARSGANRGGAADDSPTDLVRQVSATDWEMIFSAILGAATLIMAISSCAVLLPTLSIMSAAFRHNSRVISMSVRASPMRCSQIECSMIFLPNAVRDDRRFTIFCSASSALPMVRMQ